MSTETKGGLRVLPANHMKINGNDLCYRTWYIPGLPEGHTIDDLFHPYYWTLQRRVQPSDLIRVADRAGQYDVMLKVVSVETSGGVQVEFWPRFPRAMIEAGAAFEDVAGAAADAGDAIVDSMKREVNGQPVPRVEFTEGSKWRVIALTGHPHKDGFASKAAAEKELAAYAKRMRIKL